MDFAVLALEALGSNCMRKERKKEGPGKVAMLVCFGAKKNEKWF